MAELQQAQQRRRATPSRHHRRRRRRHRHLGSPCTRARRRRLEEGVLVRVDLDYHGVLILDHRRRHPRPRPRRKPPPTAAPVTGGGKLTGAHPRAPRRTAPPPTITSVLPGSAADCLHDPARPTPPPSSPTWGIVVVALDTTKTPMTANNFIVPRRYHFYDGTAISAPHLDRHHPGRVAPHPERLDPAARATRSRTRARASRTYTGRPHHGPDVSAQQRRQPVLLLRRRRRVPASTAGRRYVIFGQVTSGLDVLAEDPRQQRGHLQRARRRTQAAGHGPEGDDHRDRDRLQPSPRLAAVRRTTHDHALPRRRRLEPQDARSSTARRRCASTRRSATRPRWSRPRAR